LQLAKMGTKAGGTSLARKAKILAEGGEKESPGKGGGRVKSSQQQQRRGEFILFHRTKKEAPQSGDPGEMQSLSGGDSLERFVFFISGEKRKGQKFEGKREQCPNTVIRGKALSPGEENEIFLAGERVVKKKKDHHFGDRVIEGTAQTFAE